MRIAVVLRLWRLEKGFSVNLLSSGLPIVLKIALRWRCLPASICFKIPIASLREKNTNIGDERIASGTWSLGQSCNSSVAMAAARDLCVPGQSVTGALLTSACVLRSLVIRYFFEARTDLSQVRRVRQMALRPCGHFVPARRAKASRRSRYPGTPL